MLKQAGEPRPQQRIGNEDADDERQDPTERPPRDVQNQNDDDDGKNDVVAVGIAHPERLFLDAQGRDAVPCHAKVQRRRDTKNHENEIVDRDVADPEPAAAERHQAGCANDRKECVDQDEEASEMPPHVPVVGRKTEAGGVVMIGRECERDPPDELVDQIADFSGRKALVELALDRLKLLSVQLDVVSPRPCHVSCGADSLRPDSLIIAAGSRCQIASRRQLTASCLVRGRSARPPDAVERQASRCRRVRSRP